MAKATIEEEETKFDKKSLMFSNKFSDNRDLLNAMLEDDKQYSFSEAEMKIKEFLKGEVK